MPQVLAKKRRSSAEVILNLVLFLTCACTLGVLVYRTISTRSSVRPVATLQGTKLELEGVDWNKSKQTVVLALSTKCRFCTASAAFYRHLQAYAQSHNLPIVYVFPQGRDDAEAYLKSLGMSYQQIMQSPLAGIHVSGTPTVFIVNSNGEITDHWVGQLTPKGEEEVLSKL